MCKLKQQWLSTRMSVLLPWLLPQLVVVSELLSLDGEELQSAEDQHQTTSKLWLPQPWPTLTAFLVIPPTTNASFCLTRFAHSLKLDKESAKVTREVLWLPTTNSSEQFHGTFLALVDSQMHLWVLKYKILFWIEMKNLFQPFRIAQPGSVHGSLESLESTKKFYLTIKIRTNRKKCVINCFSVAIIKCLWSLNFKSVFRYKNFDNYSNLIRFRIDELLN